MTYSEIFILGWNLNALMFVINLILAFNVIKSADVVKVSKEHEKLSELKEQVDLYYPNRGLETLFSYIIPFAAFYRVGFRLIELWSFLAKNKEATLFDFMVYKYQRDIEKAQN
jgi:hypothetical protein